jgi:site-specific recombinase XerD
MADRETKAATGTAVGENSEAEQLYLGDAINFFLNAKRAGGRSEKTIDDYRKKLELFHRWLAKDDYDAPFINIGADDLERYIVYL